MMMHPPTTSFIKVWGCTVSLLRFFVSGPGPMIIGPGPGGLRAPCSRYSLMEAERRRPPRSCRHGYPRLRRGPEEWEPESGGQHERYSRDDGPKHLRQPEPLTQAADARPHLFPLANVEEFMAVTS